MLASQLRYVARKLVHSPLFTGVALLTLALAIGANTAVFSVVNGVLIKPLPFSQPERLVGVWHAAPGLGFEEVNQSPALHFTYLDHGASFESVGMWGSSAAAVTGLEEPEQVATMNVTYTTLPLLGITPLHGRVFSAEDDAPDAALTMVLSHSYWMNRFDGDPGVIGSTMQVNGRSTEIIGVLGPEVEFLDFEPEFYQPYRFNRAELFIGNFSYQGVARLADGVTIDQANAEVEQLIVTATELYPQGVSLDMLRDAGFAPRLRPLKQDAVGNIGDTLWILLGTVGLVLLIACANVANLFLVRADERQQEVAVRSALGASRGQVARGFLLETVLLGLIGGVIGLAFAWGGLQVLLAMAPEGLPRLDEIGIDATVLGFTLGISVLAGLLFGLFPVMRIGHDFVSALKEGGRGGGVGKQGNRTRQTLVVAQVAMALVLAVGSGLMVRSFQAMRNVEPGFDDPGELLTARVTIPSAEIEDPERLAQAHALIEENLAALGGMISVGGSNSVPMERWNSNDVLEVEEFPTGEGQLPPVRRFHWVSPTYFETMGIPVVAGRGYTWADINARSSYIVISENLASEYWDTPGEALGKRMRLPQLEGLSVDQPWREIIGVVDNVYGDGVDQDPPTTVYWPMTVANFWGDELSTQRSMVYVMRTTRIADPTLQDEMRQAVWSVNPNLPVAGVRTLGEIQRRSMARTSFTLVMLGIAAGAALLLGAVGIYGVSSYVVAQRGREIGIRMALGARHQDVRGMVLREGMTLAGIGLIVGAVVAAAATRLMAALLFGVSAVDPVTYVAVAFALATVALLANYVPARRATRVNPVEALRWK